MNDLRRDLGLLDAVAIGLGAIVGAGVFVVTGVAAGMAGPAFVVSLVLAGLVAFANALSSAQLAARFPVSGGTYEYGYEVLGPKRGFVAGWVFLTSKLAAAGAVALGLAGYAAVALPGVSPRVIAVGAIILFTILNYFGIKRSSRTNLLIVAVTLVSLLAFVALGAGSFDAGRLEPFAPLGWEGVLRAAAVLFFAFTGYARIATLGEEVHDPARTIPRAIVITISVAILLYLAVSLVMVGTADIADLSDTAAPLLIAAEGFPAGAAVPIIAVGGITAMLGVILSQLLGLSRMAFAMSRRGDLPRGLDIVHPLHGTPGRAVLVIGAIAAVIAGTGALVDVIAISMFAILVYYGLTNWAALRLPPDARLFPRWIARFGLGGCVVLALSLSVGTILLGLGIVAAGLVVRRGLRGLRARGAG